MTWCLDDPVCKDGITCVPIVDVDIVVNCDRLRLAGHGRKQPLMFLVFQGQKVTGIDPTGRIFCAEEVERQFPGAIVCAPVQKSQALP